VAIWGQRDRQLQVQVDPDRLRQHGVSLSQVITTAGNALWVSPLTFVEASTPGTGGFVDGPNQRLGIRHILPFGKPDNLGQIPIVGTHRSVRLGDVASVTEDHQLLIGDAVVGDHPGLLLVVQKLPGANTLKVTHEVQNALDELAPGLPGVQIDSHLFRPASSIEDAIHNLGLIAVIGGALVLLALVALLLEWRTVLISVVAIPLSLVVALLVLRLMGASINALVLAGLVIALGAVVDDAVGDAHRIGTRLRERRAAGTDTPTAQSVLEAALEMRSALGYATVILLLAMLPVFFAGGLTGAFVHPLAVSYVVAVLASLVVALTVTPVLGVLLFAKAPRRDGEHGLAARLAGGWAAFLSRMVRTPRPALFAFGGVLLVGFATIPLLGQSLRPSFKDRDLLVRWNAAPSISLPEMTRITTRATRELRAVRGVRDVGAHLGRAVTGDQAIGTGSGEIWVNIDPKANYDATLRSVRDVVSGYPGVHGRVLTYETDRTQGVLTPAKDEVLTRVYGEDYGVLRQQADRVGAAMSDVKGVGASHVVAPVEQPTVQIEAKIAAARRYGLKPGDVRRAAGTLVNGLDVGSFFEGQKVFTVAVRGVASTRTSVSAVRDLLIDTPGGGHVRLGTVATVKVTPVPVDITHDGVERYMDVTASVSGRSVGSARAEVQNRLERLRFPLEYNAEVITPNEDDQASAAQFPTLAIAAGIGIFLLLQAAFGSWRLAALVFLTAPMALVGGLLVVLAGGGDFSLGAAVGLFTVGGIAVRNAVVLVGRMQRLRHEGEPFGPGLVLRGVRERFAPTVMTAVALALAMAPFAIAGDIAGNEITHSTATVVLGGLVTSTLLALFVLPGLYLHFGAGALASVKLGARRSSAAPAPQVDLNI
jgi:Cu/Ag efflux pump CusA